MKKVIRSNRKLSYLLCERRSIYLFWWYPYKI